MATPRALSGWWIHSRGSHVRIQISARTMRETGLPISTTTWACRSSVYGNFERYNLLDAQVRFLKGWFRDTLPSAPIGRIAVLRLDGDMYESTMDSFTNLYDKVQVGGYIIVDDYGALANCRSAVHDFRRRRGILDPIHPIDWTGVFWQRTK